MDTTPAASQPEAPGSWKDILFRTLKSVAILVLAPTFAILLTLFVFQSYQVDGHSMQNTLQDNDRLIVWKGSRTWTRIVGGQYIPNRGDIIVVNEPDLSACGQPGSKQIIKRVIGLPGERVTYKNSIFTVYNSDHPAGFNPDKTLPYGKENTALLDGYSSKDIDVTLDDTQLFISGDHRSDSCDSRYFGAIQSSDIIGKAIVRIFPVQEIKTF